MPRRPSFAGRALLAVILMAGFYALAVAIAAGLLYIPYAELIYAHRVNPNIALSCIVAAGLILWSILPRPDRFTAPGPLLEPVKNPRLLETIRGIASAVGQEPPAEIYLLPDVNAWVAQRGGFMGLGSRRVMGLGLPLMGILTVPQLRAVLAHEFGHFHGGDTALGPWIYRTRAALARTLQSLSERGSIVQMPFRWYGNLFLRLTRAVSRRQELAADALASGIAGRMILAEGLRAVHAAAPIYGAYVQRELTPVLNAGFLPPVAEGFARFLEAPEVASILTRHLEEGSSSPPVNPFDTHPPLRARLEALGVGLRGEGRKGDAEPALTLMGSVLREEGRLLAPYLIDHQMNELIQVSWCEVGSHVYLPAWQTLVSQESPALVGMTPANLPETIRQPRAFGSHLAKTARRVLQPEESARFAASTVGAALVIALVARGWTLQALPGAPVTLFRDGDRLEPFSVQPRLRSGELSADEWRRFCASAGIGAVELWKLQAGPPPGVDTRSHV